MAILVVAFFVRFVGIDAAPPLYTDEASLGYSAYSIAKTGRDEFGSFLPVSLRSFGDYKPPLSAYLMIPAIFLFGLSPITIRFPSVILGTATVWLLYWLVSMRTRDHRWAVASALVLALSPWHIHESRMAMLVSVSLFWFMLGVVSWYRGLDRRGWFFLAAISFACAVYSYYGMRVTVPFMLGYLVVSSWKKLRAHTRVVVAAGAVFLISLAPLGYAFRTNTEVIFGRARHVSVFADNGVRLRLWEAATTDALLSPEAVRIFHNKLFMYTEDVVRRFFAHLEPTYLFWRGDKAEPFEVPNVGLLWLFELPLVAIGIAKLSRMRKSILWLVWTVVSIVPAALTFVTPASNRSFPLVIPLAVASGGGIVSVVSARRFLSALTLALVWVIFFAFAAYSYALVLPRDIGKRVYSGARDGAEALRFYLGMYDRVVISERARLPYVHLLVFYRYDPRLLQSELRIRPGVDQFGYEHVDRFGKIEYREDIVWRNERIGGKTLYIVAPSEGLPESEFHPRELSELHTLNGEPSMRFLEVDRR